LHFFNTSSPVAGTPIAVRHRTSISFLHSITWFEALCFPSIRSTSDSVRVTGSKMLVQFANGRRNGWITFHHKGLNITWCIVSSDNHFGLLFSLLWKLFRDRAFPKLPLTDLDFHFCLIRSKFTRLEIRSMRQSKKVISSRLYYWIGSFWQSRSEITSAHDNSTSRCVLLWILRASPVPFRSTRVTWKRESWFRAELLGNNLDLFIEWNIRMRCSTNRSYPTWCEWE
jgi:hypothetical protein